MSKRKLTKEMEVLLALSIGLEEMELLNILLIPKLQKRGIDLYLMGQPTIKSLVKVFFQITRNPYSLDHNVIIGKKIKEKILSAIYYHKEFSYFEQEQVLDILKSMENKELLNYFFNLFATQKKGRHIIKGCRLGRESARILIESIACLNHKNMDNLLKSDLENDKLFTKVVTNYPHMICNKNLHKFFQNFEVEEDKVIQMLEKHPTSTVILKHTNTVKYRGRVINALLSRKKYDKILKLYPDSDEVWLEKLKTDGDKLMVWQKIREKNPDLKKCLLTLNVLFSTTFKKHIDFSNEKEIIANPTCLHCFDLAIDEAGRETYEDIIKYMFELQKKEDVFYQSLIFLLLFIDDTEYTREILNDPRFEPKADFLQVAPILMYQEIETHLGINRMMFEQIWRIGDKIQIEKLFNIFIFRPVLEYNDYSYQYDILMECAKHLTHNVKISSLQQETIFNIATNLPKHYFERLSDRANNIGDIIKLLGAFNYKTN